MGCWSSWHPINKQIQQTNLLCITDLFGKYAWVVHLNDKKGVAIVNEFQGILNSSKRKPNKIRVYLGSQC